jgi:hypothetical protein
MPEKKVTKVKPSEELKELREIKVILKDIRTILDNQWREIAPR